MSLEIYLRPTVQQWENDDELIKSQLMLAFATLIVNNKLKLEDYEPVLGWNQTADDFTQNRITLRITAKKRELPILK